MSYMFFARDGDDAEALDRRMAIRGEHFAYARKQAERGVLTGGGAMKDDEGRLIGSVGFLAFETREEVDAHLESVQFHAIR